MLQSMGLQRVGHKLVTEQQITVIMCMGTAQVDEDARPPPMHSLAAVFGTGAHMRTQRHPPSGDTPYL